MQLGLAGILAASAMAIGAAHWAVACAFGLLVVGGGWLVRRELALGWNPCSTFFLALAVWSGLQAVPWPLGLLEGVDATSARLWSTSLDVLGIESTWGSPSLDQGASLLEASKWTAYAIIASASARLASARGMHGVLLIVAGVSLLVATTSLAHALLEAEAVFGLYRPVGVPSHLGPFINPNNLAGYMNLGVFAGLALLVSQKQMAPRPLLATQIVLCVAACVLSASRGGVLALVVGFVLLLVGQSLTRRGPFARRSGTIYVGVLLVVGLVVGLLGTSSESARELFDDDLEKLQLLGDLPALFRDHFWLGVGRGAFDSASGAYQGGGRIVFRSVECFPLSWAAEWGVPVAVVALCGLFWWFRPSRLHLGASRGALAVWVGLVVLALQNLFDLGLEVAGLMAAAAALIGAIEGSRRSRASFQSPVPEEEPFRWNPTLSVGALIAGSLFASLAIVSGTDVFHRRLELADRLEASAVDSAARENLLGQLTEPLRRYPADSFFRIAGGVLALRSSRDPLPWAAAALERNPRSGRAHYLAARALRDRGALGQALLHLREFARLEPERSDLVATTAVGWSTDPVFLERVVPSGSQGYRVLLGLGSAFPDASRPVTRRRFFERAWERAPNDVSVLARLAFELTTDVQKKSAPCAPETRCPLVDAGAAERRARQLAVELARNDEKSCAPARVESRLLAVGGRGAEALRLLGERCGACTEATACQMERVALADAEKDPLARRAAESAYLAVACRDTNSCVRAESWLGARAKGRADWLRAYAHFSRAAARQPTAALWLAAAEAAARSGQLTPAKLALEHASALGGKDDAIEKLVQSSASKSLRELAR